MSATTSFRQPAPLLERDMEALLTRMERAEDRLMRWQSPKRRAAGQKELDFMAERYEALKEQRNRIEVVF